MENPLRELGSTPLPMPLKALFGHDQQWWLDSFNTWLIWGAILGAIGSVLVGICTAITISLSRQIRDHDIAAANAYQVKVRGDIGTAYGQGIVAGERAVRAEATALATAANLARANERAAALQKEAAATALQAEILKSRISWRELTHRQREILESDGKQVLGTVNVEYTDSDPEALSLALQITRSLREAGLNVGIAAVKLPNDLIFGFRCDDRGSESGRKLADIFERAGISITREQIPGAIGFNSTLVNEPIATVFVGSKPFLSANSN